MHLCTLYNPIFPDPGLFASAKRALLAEKQELVLNLVLETSGQHLPALEKQKVFENSARLKSLPWRIPSKGDFGWNTAKLLILKLQEEIAHFHLQSWENPSLRAQEDQMWRFEAICQLLAYMHGDEEEVVKEMLANDNLREAIIQLSKDVLSKNTETSGIAPRQLERFAKSMLQVSHMSRTLFKLFLSSKFLLVVLIIHSFFLCDTLIACGLC